MIRTKNKIYGEPNIKTAVIATNNMQDNQLIVGNWGQEVKAVTFPPNSLLSGDTNTGALRPFVVNIPNTIVGTNSANQLILFERPRLPTTPPTGRVLVAEALGSTTPSGPLGVINNLRLPGPYWYEIEVIGAGGGAGSGASHITSASATGARWGGSGGAGGYWRGFMPLEVNQLATLQAGNSGGAGEGYTVDTSGKQERVSGTPRGGQGGRTPIINYLTPNLTTTQINEMAGVDMASFENLTTDTITRGGIGQNGGANGGAVIVMAPAFNPNNANAQVRGGTGGGANGAYGGRGGDSLVARHPSVFGQAGTGGGAGGGFGIGGRGGRGRSSLSGQGTVEAVSSVGGGSGGSHGDSSSNLAGYLGAGGGGGGGSRFYCGDFEILCGGGGGGAGAGQSILAGGLTNSIGQSSQNTGSQNGAPGTNNMNTQLGGSANGGLRSTNHLATTGSNGGRGIVRIWRCIE